MSDMEAKVVNCGIDSLVIGFLIGEYRDLKAFAVLEEAKAKAGEKLFGGRGSSVTWFGKDFVVLAHGAKGYEWVLENADVGVCIARRAQNGKVLSEVYVTFRAEYLWREGHVGAVAGFREWLASWAVVKGDRVSRCDLCMDIQMDMPKIDLARETVTRARNKTEYFPECQHYVSGRRDTGYRVGSGQLIARIYDKSLEITVTQKQWFRTIWSANGWDGESRVIRVEFQARRDFLKEMSVDSFLSLCERSADMWRYYTWDWLTIRVPCGDSHRYRWALYDWWEVAQGGFTLFGKAYGVLRNRQHEFKRGRMMKQVKGTLVSFLAECSAGYGVEHGSLWMGRQMREIREIQQWLGSAECWEAVMQRKSRFMPMTMLKQTHLVNAVVRAGGQITSVEYPNAEDGKV